jgi:toxin ParE1/3/4
VSISRAEAEREYAEAVAYYEAQRAGLGLSFDLELGLVLKRVAERPEAHQIVFADVRRGVLKRFPYVLYFRSHPDRIEVLAVFYARRDPQGVDQRE